MTDSDVSNPEYDGRTPSTRADGSHRQLFKPAFVDKTNDPQELILKVRTNSSLAEFSIRVDAMDNREK